MAREMEGFRELRAASASCPCGRRHVLMTKEVFLDRGVRRELAAVLARLVGEGAAAMVVSDETTRRVAGAVVGMALSAAGFAVREVVIPGRRPHADEATAARIIEANPEECSVLVAVGSGTITDLVRLAAHRTGKPFAVVPTAASMDGYASPVVPMLIGGAKQSTPATPPVAVLVDLDLVATAPLQMTMAGLGDLAGKITARADWVLAHLLIGEEICLRLADLSVEALEKAREDPAGMREGRFPALTAVMEGLLTAGLAMQMVGSSRPASGAEHHLAHHWEERDLIAGREGPLHGTYVGVAAPIAASLARRLAGLEGSEVERRLAARASEGPALQVFRWEEVRRAILRLVPEPAAIRGILAEAGAPSTPGEVGLAEREVLDALLHAHERRPRFTSLTLAHRLGLMEEWAPAIVEEVF